MEEVILTILINHCAANGVAPQRLAPAIISAAESYDLDPVQLAQIIITESRCKEHAYNKRTHDIGLMQINVTTAALYHFNTSKLYDWDYNLDAGAKVLADFDRICRYNVGTAKLHGPRLDRCLHYERKLASFN